jgi:tRNA-2-methylthio-N6-dimethylallyladenosine synthase
MKRGAMNNFYIETYGCQMNERDSLRIASILKNMGLKAVEEPDEADVIIVNTCSIREKSEHKVYSALGRYRRLKNKKKLILGVAGCVAQQVGERFFEKVPELDMVLGTHNIHKLEEIISQSSSGNIQGSKIVETEFFNTDAEKRFFAPLADDFNSITAFVTIMEGCDNFCTYCVVPYLRGRELSRPADDILKEIKTLVKKGVKEVTLLGQNVNSYKSAQDPEIENGKNPVNFVELIRMISDIDGLERIRFTSSHPKDLSDGLISLFRELPKLCKHIHLPVQSGSNKILKAMNRKYTREDYLKLIDKLRHSVPDIAITTDIIVGFPGETDDDFEDTMSLLDIVRFGGTFSFKFSPRPITPSAKMDCQVPYEVKTERIVRLQEFQRKICLEKNRELIGTEQEVLVEGESAEGKGQLMGRTSTNRIVNFYGSSELKGKLIKIKITDATPNSLIGVPV